MSSDERLAITTGHLLEKSTVDDEIVVRLARPEDLPQIEGIAAQEHFDVGLHNLQLYYATSPHSWYVAVTREDRVVAYDAYNDLGRRVFWGFQILVDSEYRGKKVTSRMYQQYGKLDQLGNSTPQSLVRYHFDYYEFRVNGHWGIVPSKTVPPAVPLGSRVVEITGENLSRVIAYDRTILKHFDRAEFLQSWLLAESSVVQSFAIVDDSSEILGFGAVRRYSDFHMINPCYAETGQLGMILLTQLMSVLNPNDQMFMESPASNPTSELFAHQVGMLKTSTEIRVYKMPWGEYDSRFKGKIPEAKIFAMQDYWPV